MKELFKKLFSKKTSTPVFVGFGVFAIFTFIVFPGLTVANTFLNIVASLVGIFTLTFIFYYIDGDKFFSTVSNEIEPGETELDYLPKEEVVKKKRATKKKAEQHIIHPKADKVLGEFQIKNKEKVRKSTIKNK